MECSKLKRPKDKKDISKTTYKLLLLTLRYIPVLLGLLYIIYSFLNYFGKELPVIYTLSKMSIIVWIFMHLSSIVFRFCIYFRSFLYYIFLINTCSLLHNCFGINYFDYTKVMLHLSILGVVLLILLICHVKDHKESAPKYYK